MHKSVGHSFSNLVKSRQDSMSLVLLASMVALILFVPTHIIADCCYNLAAIELVLAFAVCTLYVLLRRGAAMEKIETSLMVCATILFSALILTDSLVFSGAYWAAGYPFISYFIKSVHRARYWVLAFWLEIVLLALLSQLQLISLPYTPVQLSCLSVVVGFFWLLAHIYQSQYEAQRRRLDASYHQIDKHRSRLKTLLDHAPNSIWMMDTEGRIRFANRAMERWTGVSEATLRETKDYSSLLPDDVAKRSRAADQACLEGADDVYHSQDVMLNVHGQPRTFDLIRVKLRDGHNNITGLVGFAIDISDRLAAEMERQQLEYQVLHMQRLESLGLMAGGVAHDFNNLLTAMQGGIDLARLESELSPASLESLQSAETAIQAAGDLCQQMLAYSGKGFLEPEILYIDELFEEMRALLLASIGKHIELSLECDKNLPAIRGDKGQIRQIILNMIINAAEAIGDTAGEIHIHTRRKHITTERDLGGVNSEPLAPGSYVVFDISDNGPGMSEEVQAHVFDPFFTTKFTGRGLGMSAVLGIVRTHCGALIINSAEGKGTTMQVWLPATDEVPAKQDAQQSKTSDERPLSPEERGGVLVIDDEPDVMRVATRMLEHLGFRVLCANNGVQGVDLYRERQDDIDWVLLDMTMPHMNGDECRRELRKINPDIYVVMSSGYNKEAWMTETIQNPSPLSEHEKPQDFLKKPYNMAKLSAVCDRAMNR